MHRLLRGVDGQMRILCELDCGVIESGGEHKEPLANQLPRGAMVVTVLASSGWGGARNTGSARGAEVTES